MMLILKTCLHKNLNIHVGLKYIISKCINIIDGFSSKLNISKLWEIPQMNQKMKNIVF